MILKSLLLTATLSFLVGSGVCAQVKYEYAIVNLYTKSGVIGMLNDEKSKGLNAMKTDFTKVELNDSILFSIFKRYFFQLSKEKWELYAEENNSSAKDILIYYIRKDKNWHWQPQKAK